MEVKVDPGSETNCIPLSHFRRLFPQLCSKDGSPKENALEPTLAQFEAYDGGIMTNHGWIILPTQDIRDNKFHPVRYYVVTREEARILISHATVTWLGLMKVLCPNKAPRIKRQVASVSKKANEPPKPNNSNSLSGSQHPPKAKNTGTVTVKDQQYELPTSKPRSHKRRCRRGRPAHREEEDQVDNRSGKFQTSQTNNGKATSLGGRQSVLPRQISTPSQSEIKSVSNNRSRSSTSRITTPSQSENSGFLPKRQYYQPQDDEDTYYINSEGHLQCHQDSQTIIKAPTPQELPGSKEHPIFHKPGSIKISSVEDLLRLYPNSFDRLGSLKGEYDIKVDPTVPPVQHARRKVPIESKAAIEEAIDYMVKQDILEPQIEPTPWVSSVTYPVKPTGEVRPCLDARDLNKAIIRENHKPQTVEEIAHQLAGAVVFTKADALKAFLQVHLTEESSKLLVINTHKGRYRFKRMPFRAKMSQDVFQMKMDLIMERCPGVISIHDDIVVYGVSEEDHDANLVNLLNVAQIEGLVLNSKKLELKRPRVSFFGAEYSADGMHPCPKKIQGITEMTPPLRINNNWPASLEWSHTWETSCHISAIILNHSGQCSSKRWSLHGMKWQMPASRRSRISLPRVPPSHSDTMTKGNQSQYRRMPPKEDLVRAFYRMASQLHTPARASQTLRPGTQTSKESSLPLYSLVNGSTPTCWEGHLQWSPIINHWK